MPWTYAVAATLIVIGMFVIGQTLEGIKMAIVDSSSRQQARHDELKDWLDLLHRDLADLNDKLPELDPSEPGNPYG